MMVIPIQMKTQMTRKTENIISIQRNISIINNLTNKTINLNQLVAF